MMKHHGVWSTVASVPGQARKPRFAVRLKMVERVLVPVGLAGLREQDQRCRVGGLRREGEIQQDERIGIPAKADRKGVHRDPRDHRDRLAGYVLRRAEEARCGFSASPEGVFTKSTRHMRHTARFGMAGAGPSPRFAVCSLSQDQQPDRSPSALAQH
jgi:hypothetical protein